MGGSQVNAGNYIKPPDSTLPMAMLANSASIGRQQLASQNELLKMVTGMPVESWTPDIFGNQGALTQAGQIAAINAFRSKQLEQQSNPAAAQAREAIQQSVAQDTSPDYWQKQMNEWARTKGLESYLGSGLKDSTIGKSGFFDQATAQGQAFRNANIARAQSVIGNAPVAGIDPAQAIAAEQAAQAQNYQQRQGLRQAGVAGAQANQQSTTDWINQLMGQTSQAVNANQQEWQNYQQAMLTGATNNAASQNSMTGAYIGAGGAAVGMLGAAAIIA